MRFLTLIPSMVRSPRGKINKETVAFYDTVVQRDLKDLYQNMTAESSRIHILLRNTWNVLQ